MFRRDILSVPELINRRQPAEIFDRQPVDRWIEGDRATSRSQAATPPQSSLTISQPHVVTSRPRHCPGLCRWRRFKTRSIYGQFHRQLFVHLARPVFGQASALSWPTRCRRCCPQDAFMDSAGAADHNWLSCCCESARRVIGLWPLAGLAAMGQRGCGGASKSRLRDRSSVRHVAGGKHSACTIEATGSMGGYEKQARAGRPRESGELQFSPPRKGG